MAVKLPDFRKGKQWSDYTAAEWQDLRLVVSRFANMEVVAPLIFEVAGEQSRLRFDGIAPIRSAVSFIVPCRVVATSFADTVEVEPEGGGSPFHVAKPWLLRITYKLDAAYRRAGLRFQAAGSDPTGSIVAIRDSDGLAETWRTTLPYEIDDVVYATELGDVFDLEVDGVPVIWMDLNIDGRTWAADVT